MEIGPEVREHMRAAERLIGYARQTGQLNDDECSILMYYLKEIEREIAPLCQNHCDTSESK